MKLSKPLYENLPYIYFLISGYLLSSGEELVLIFSAALFYGAGCITLVTRSSHRRLDKRMLSKEYTVPEIIYEYLPYGYAAIAIFTLMLATNPYIQFAAFSLCIFAIRILLFRHNNRCKAKTLF